MGLKDLLNRANVELTQFASAYARACHGYPRLAAFATIADLLRALSLPSTLSSKERNRLVALIVRAHHKSPHPLWRGILLQAFAPMLLRLRGRLRNDAPDELNQLVIASFLEAVERLAQAGHSRWIARRLRDATTRAVFQAQRMEMRHALLSERPVDWLDDASEQNARHEVRSVSGRAAECAAWLEDLLHTLVEKGQLRAYTRARYPHAPPEEKERHYRRLQKRRLRLALKLRKSESKNAA